MSSGRFDSRDAYPYPELSLNTQFQRQPLFENAQQWNSSAVNSPYTPNRFPLGGPQDRKLEQINSPFRLMANQNILTRSQTDRNLNSQFQFSNKLIGDEPNIAGTSSSNLQVASPIQPIRPSPSTGAIKRLPSILLLNDFESPISKINQKQKQQSLSSSSGYLPWGQSESDSRLESQSIMTTSATDKYSIISSSSSRGSKVAAAGAINLTKLQRNSEISLELTSPRRAQDPHFEETISQYLLYFPHLNFTADKFNNRNAELLSYLIQQEAELIETIQKPSGQKASQELKLQHLSVVSQLISNIKQSSQTNIGSSRGGQTKDNTESVDYDSREGFLVKWILIEKLAHEVENIVIDFGIFRKGDMLKTYRNSDTLPTINLNYKFNKCVINNTESFKNINPTVNTFIYFDIKAVNKKTKEQKSICWTMHTLFDENKRIVQGGFKLPLYSKNHIPHALFQTGFPYMSDLFMYIEVFPNSQNFMNQSQDYSKFSIPPFHQKEKLMEKIEEDVAINSLVEERVKVQGVIKSTLTEEEQSKREYNAKVKLNIIKKEVQRPSIIDWVQDVPMQKTDKPQARKSYLSELPAKIEKKDIFSQINQRIETKKAQAEQSSKMEEEEHINIPAPVIPIAVGVPSAIIEESEEEVEPKKESERQIQLTTLSQTSVKLKNKRELSAKIKKKEPEVHESDHVQVQKGTVSKTMKRILEKKNQQKSSRDINSSLRIDTQKMTEDSLLVGNQGNSDGEDDLIQREVLNQTTLKNSKLYKISAQVRALSNWKSATVVCEMEVISVDGMKMQGERNEELREANLLSIQKLEKSKAQFNQMNYLFCFRHPGTADLKLRISLKEQSGSQIGDCVIDLVSNKRVISQPILEAIALYKNPADKKSIVKPNIDLSITEEKQMELFEEDDAVLFNPNSKIIINLIELQGYSTALPLKINIEVYQGGELFKNDFNERSQFEVIDTFNSNTKTKSIELSKVRPIFPIDPKQLIAKYAHYLHKLFVVITIKEEKKGKSEEIGWTYVQLFQGQVVNEQTQQLQLYKPPTLQNLHLIDPKQLKALKYQLVLKQSQVLSPS